VHATTAATKAAADAPRTRIAGRTTLLTDGERDEQRAERRTGIIAGA
jgi:hypothetical protein